MPQGIKDPVVAGSGIRSKFLVVFTTTGSLKEARRLARLLVQNRLAACVNLASSVESIYWWQGKVARGRETLLLIKTARSRLSRLYRRLRSLHSYDLPEFIAIPITAGEKNYLKWLQSNLGPDS